MKFTHIIFVLLCVIMFSGCGPFILAAGSIVGMGYVANDIEENYNGDGQEYLQDKTNTLVDTVSGN